MPGWIRAMIEKERAELRQLQVDQAQLEEAHKANRMEQESVQNRIAELERQLHPQPPPPVQARD